MNLGGIKVGIFDTIAELEITYIPDPEEFNEPKPT
jgi:hypothetical protein